MSGQAPYLSVVVTTRNDGHGGNPLERFQAFVNCLTVQCHRTNLPAELIVVEWNPPTDQPPLRDALQWPLDSPCEIRIIQVPAELHRTLKQAEALPLFQMIAKNVGIRRSRGQFVLCTNIDILLSNELVDAIARRTLGPGVMYRVDRHDIEADVPSTAPLAELMDYCRTHQIRKNTRWGTFPLDHAGRPALWNDDIVDFGSGIELGGGWHMREGAAGASWRWVTERAEVIIDSSPQPRLMNIEIEANPLVPDAVVQVSVADSATGELLADTALSNVFRGPTTVQLAIAPASSVRHLTFSARSSAERDTLPLYELRDQMTYRIRRIYWDSEKPRSRYAAVGWRAAADGNAWIGRGYADDAGIAVVTSSAYLRYAVEYGPMTAPKACEMHFWITLRLSQGTVAIQALRGDRAGFLPTRNRFFKRGDDVYDCEIAIDVEPGEQFWFVISNAREHENRSSRFTILDFWGSVPQERLMSVADLDGNWWTRMKSCIKGWLGQPANQSPPADDNGSPSVDASVGAQPASEPASTLAALESSRRFLIKFRPDNLHLNACGDFQLMSRTDWCELRGFAEFEMYSMNIDGLFGHTAYYAGIREHVFQWPACAYHIEHESGSGWTPEGEDKLRKRIEERGIGWLDSTTVTMLASFMKSVNRPMIFNGPDWGFAQHQLPETVLTDVIVR